jgi:hypothetical protein
MMLLAMPFVLYADNAGRCGGLPHCWETKTELYL